MKASPIAFTSVYHTDTRTAFQAPFQDPNNGLVFATVFQRDFYTHRHFNGPENGLELYAVFRTWFPDRVTGPVRTGLGFVRVSGTNAPSPPPPNTHTFFPLPPPTHTHHHHHHTPDTRHQHARRVSMTSERDPVRSQSHHRCFRIIQVNACFGARWLPWKTIQVTTCVLEASG